MAPKKKAAPKKVEASEIIVILDRSGSMQSIKTDMEGGLASFVAEQAKVPGECRFTLVQFDDRSRDVVYDGVLIGDVKAITLNPRGSTPLLDAVGDTITERKAKTGRVTCLIITDGQENASREWKRESVKRLVEEVTAKGWAVSYLGANVDAFHEAGSLGVVASSAGNFRPDSAGVAMAFAAAGAANVSYRAGGGYAIPDSLRSDLDKKRPAKAK